MTGHFSHFNCMVLSEKALFSSSGGKTMLILIFFLSNHIFPQRREFSGICHRLNYCPKFVPCPCLLHLGFYHMLCFGQWDLSDVVQAEAYNALVSSGLPLCIPVGTLRSPTVCTLLLQPGPLHEHTCNSPNPAHSPDHSSVTEPSKPCQPTDGCV